MLNQFWLLSCCFFKNISNALCRFNWSVIWWLLTYPKNRNSTRLLGTHNPDSRIWISHTKTTWSSCKVCFKMITQSFCDVMTIIVQGRGWWCRGLFQFSEAGGRWFRSRCHQSWEECIKVSATMRLCDLFRPTQPNDWGSPLLRVKWRGSLLKDLESCKGIPQLSCKNLGQYKK